MPRILRGEALANAIYQATDKLEDEFAKVFIGEVRKLSRSKALQELLDEVEAGQLVGTGVTSRLNILSVPTAKLDELIRKAMGSAIRITNEKTGLKLSFDYRNPNVIQAARTMSIDLSTTLTKTARQILEKTVGDAIEGIVTRRQAIKIIESRIGLIPAHAEAVERYYERLIADGRKRIDAQRLADKYADRLLRYRATTIARTEIARATGIGQGEFWKQALLDGALPPKTKRVWITAADERVCEICGPMDGLQIEIGQPWMTRNGLVDYPSAAHPNCRCTQGIALTKDYLRMFREEIAERQDTIDALQKLDSHTIDWWLLEKANKYHDALGRFTSADSAVAPKGRRPKLKRKAPKKITLGEKGYGARTTIEKVGEGVFRYSYGFPMHQQEFTVDINGYPLVVDPENIPIVPVEQTFDIDRYEGTDLAEMAGRVLNEQWNQWEGNFAIRTIASNMMDLSVHSEGSSGLSESAISGIIGLDKFSDYPELFVPAAHSMLVGIAESKKTDFSVSRAMVVPEDSSITYFGKGDELSIPPSGFTPSKSLLQDFQIGGMYERNVQGESYSTINPVEVVFVLQRGAKGVRSATYGELGMDSPEGKTRLDLPIELVTGGKFKIVKREDYTVERKSNYDYDSSNEPQRESRGVRYTIVQTEFFNPETGKYEKN